MEKWCFGFKTHFQVHFESIFFSWKIDSNLPTKSRYIFFVKRIQEKLFLQSSHLQRGSGDSREPLVPGNHWFPNFLEGTHVVLEPVVPGDHWVQGITGSPHLGMLPMSV